jgi:hypothetical protein
MHLSRINMYDHPKIMIKSPEVYFVITKQHGKVGHKNIIIFSHKNHIGSFCIIGKQFI